MSSRAKKRRARLLPSDDAEARIPGVIGEVIYAAGWEGGAHRTPLDDLRAMMTSPPTRETLFLNERQVAEIVLATPTSPIDVEVQRQCAALLNAGVRADVDPPNPIDDLRARINESLPPRLFSDTESRALAQSLFAGDLRGQAILEERVRSGRDPLSPADRARRMREILFGFRSRPERITLDEFRRLYMSEVP